MAADIGVKMSVSGVNQFKSSMNQAKSSVKALDAELKLNAAQYKATGDAETYMANRTKLLGDQIKSQEEVVANAQKALEAMAAQGVDKASASYTQMQAALAKAKTDLVNMQAAAKGAGDELTKVGDSSSEMSNSLKSIDKGIKFQNLTSALDKVDGMLKNILSSAINIGKSIWDWGRDAASWADDTLTNAMMYGLDVETYQRYESAAGKIDTSVEAIIKANDKLLASTKDAQDGMALITVGEEQYGVAVKDVNGQTRDQLDIFWDVLEIMRSIENETDRNALAQEYFGKSYRELIPILEKGKDAWDEAAAAASTVGEEDVNALGNLSDKLQDFNEKWEATTRTLMAKLAPAIETVADALMHMMDLLGEWASSPEGQKAISNIGDSVANLIKRFAETDFEALFDKATAAVEKIGEFLSQLSSDDILGYIEKIGAGIALWKITDTALSAFITGKMLMRGGGISTGASAGGGGGSSTAVVPAVAGSKLAALGTTLAQLGVGAIMINELNADDFEGTFEYWVAKNAPSIAKGIWGSNMVNKASSANVRGSIASYIDTLSGKTNAYSDETIAQMMAYLTGSKYYGAYNGLIAEAGSATEEKAYRAANFLSGYYLYGAANGSTYNMTTDSRGAAAMQDFIANGSQEIWDFIEASNYSFDVLKEVMRELTSDEGISVDRLYAHFTEGYEEAAAAAADAGTNAAQQIAEGAQEGSDTVTETGEELSEAFYEGLLSNYAAAYDAGAALGQAFAAGVGSAGGYRTSEINNFENINAVNVYGATNPAEILAAYRQEMQKNIAGYGG